jgi:outer membrane protein OmpA-like peptidoglycan-associated protein
MSAGGALAETGLAEAGDIPAAPEPTATEPAPEQSLAEAGNAAAESAPAEPGQAESGQAGSAEAGSEDAQTAALPPQSAVAGQVSVSFAEGASELSPEAKSSLDEVAERLRGDDGLRVQLLAYAVAIDDNTSRARRMSLSRALAVRAYLIEKGVRSTRMDVRALGSNVDGEPADRVDIIPQAQ